MKNKSVLGTVNICEHQKRKYLRRSVIRCAKDRERRRATSFSSVKKVLNHFQVVYDAYLEYVKSYLASFSLFIIASGQSNRTELYRRIYFVPLQMTRVKFTETHLQLYH